MYPTAKTIKGSPFQQAKYYTRCCGGCGKKDTHSLPKWPNLAGEAKLTPIKNRNWYVITKWKLFSKENWSASD